MSRIRKILWISDVFLNSNEDAEINLNRFVKYINEKRSDRDFLKIEKTPLDENRYRLKIFFFIESLQDAKVVCLNEQASYLIFKEGFCLQYCTIFNGCDPSFTKIRVLEGSYFEMLR